MGRRVPPAAVPDVVRLPFLLLLLGTPLAALEQLNLLLPNDRSLPMGEIGSIEGSAIVARTSGTAASWYNPAGLAGQHRNEVMAAASIYDYSVTKVESAYGQDERRTLNVLPGSAGISESLPTWIGGDGEWGVGLMVATPVYWRTSVAQQETARTATGSIAISNTYDATYEVYLPTLAVGRKFGDHAWGFSGSAYIHQLSVSTASTYARLPEGDVGTSSIQYHGRSVLLRAGFGWQWKDGSWALGATAALPGIRVYREGDRTDNQVISSLANNGVYTAQGSTNDYPLDLEAPAQISLGAARTAADWSLELDVTLTGGESTHDVFPSYQLNTVRVENGVTTTGSSTIAATSSDRRVVVNGALGGAYHIHDAWWAHAGILSDRSPIETSQLFSKVDLITVTAGLSVESEHALTTAGFATTWNTNGSTTAVDLPSGDQTAGDLSIHSWRVLLGTAYRF
jgi:hypothetical protein